MSVIDDFLSNLAEPNRQALQHVRELILQAAPSATEVITYGMPGFTYKGKYLISFAAFKDHLSVFPGAETIDVLQERLTGFKTSKGTIQFTLENPLPDDLVIAITKERVGEIETAAQHKR